MNMDNAFKTFLIECEELLQDMEDRLMAVEESGLDEDSINSIFRDVHTIKGSAGLFGLDGIVSFTHVLESALDRVRSGEIGLNDSLTSLMLSCKDHISVLVSSIEGETLILSEENVENGEKLVAQLKVYLNDLKDADDGNAPEQEANLVEARFNVVILPGESVANDNWHISVHFDADVLRNGMDPLSILRYLNTIGRIENIVTLFDRMPAAAEMDPEACYLGYEINFHSDVDKLTIENAFEFIKEDCRLHIIPPCGRIEEFLEVIDGLSEELKLGEILIACGTLTERELEQILSHQSQAEENRRKLGEIVVEDQLAHPEVVEAALVKQSSIKKSKDKITQTVRVDAEKLDYLINLIGELVIAGAGVETEVRGSGIASLRESALTLTRLIEDVRDGALYLRMVQIGETFHRFQRVVRDVSKELGKSIDLEIAGGETELDKSVVEKISDPLMHLVRNAIDHGIESPSERSAKGKSENGKLTLYAYHESGSIVIEVTDDGRGLDKQKLYAKALEKNIIEKGGELSDQQIFQLIFEPGFSTAEQVSNISGRGVGMDVVRRNIESLRGSIEIDSESGSGTTVRIRLPLTLAIIDGFMMGVGDSSYVVPLDIVEECIELTDSHVSRNEGGNYINLRGEVLPFIRLRDHFHEKGEVGKRENIVVVKYGVQKAGFVVDRLMGEFQTVIKPMGALFEHIKGISGSTILGSGEVALILDTPALITKAMDQEMAFVANDLKLVSSN